MPRIEPRSFLRFIVDEWPLIEAIYERTQTGPLRAQTLFDLADMSKTPNVTQRLIDMGVVVQLPHSPSFEMGDFVQDIIADLKKEHTLGLALEIRVYLEDLNRHTRQIVAALEEKDLEKLHRHAVALDSRIKTILRHLHNNTAAVDEIVLRAKTRRTYVPARQRYGEVLEAWESYVEPLREMVEPSGPFEALFERIERELAHATRKLAKLSGAIKERRIFDVLVYRLVQLRSQLKIHLTLTAERLLPLVREVRRNSAVARGATIALQRIRRDGFFVAPIPEWLPVQRKVAPNAVSAEEHIEAYVADISKFKPKPQRLITSGSLRAQSPRRIDPERVLGQLRDDLPVEDLLDWLIGNYDRTVDLDDLLDLYFMVRDQGKGLETVPDGRHWYETRTHRIEAPTLRVDRIGGRRKKR